MKATLLIFFLATGIPACVQLRQRHDLEERTAAAVRTLRSAYVLTPNQKLQIVYVNAWAGNMCIEYVTDDARSQPIIRYALAEKDSKYVVYDLDREDIEESCSIAGVDLTEVAEKELKTF